MCRPGPYILWASSLEILLYGLKLLRRQRKEEMRRGDKEKSGDKGRRMRAGGLEREGREETSIEERIQKMASTLSPAREKNGSAED